MSSLQTTRRNRRVSFAEEIHTVQFYERDVELQATPPEEEDDPAESLYQMERTLMGENRSQPDEQVQVEHDLYSQELDNSGCVSMQTGGLTGVTYTYSQDNTFKYQPGGLADLVDEYSGDEYAESPKRTDGGAVASPRETASDPVLAPPFGWDPEASRPERTTSSPIMATRCSWEPAVQRLEGSLSLPISHIEGLFESGGLELPQGMLDATTNNLIDKLEPTQSTRAEASAVMASPTSPLPDWPQSGSAHTPEHHHNIDSPPCASPHGPRPMELSTPTVDAYNMDVDRTCTLLSDSSYPNYSSQFQPQDAPANLEYGFQQYDDQVADARMKQLADLERTPPTQPNIVHSTLYTVTPEQGPVRDFQVATGREPWSGGSGGMPCDTREDSLAYPTYSSMSPWQAETGQTVQNQSRRGSIGTIHTMQSNPSVIEFGGLLADAVDGCLSFTPSPTGIVNWQIDTPGTAPPMSDELLEEDPVIPPPLQPSEASGCFASPIDEVDPVTLSPRALRFAEDSQRASLSPLPTGSQSTPDTSLPCPEICSTTSPADKQVVDDPIPASAGFGGPVDDQGVTQADQEVTPTDQGMTPTDEASNEHTNMLLDNTNMLLAALNTQNRDGATMNGCGTLHGDQTLKSEGFTAALLADKSDPNPSLQDRLGADVSPECALMDLNTLDSGTGDENCNWLTGPVDAVTPATQEGWTRENPRRSPRRPATKITAQEVVPDAFKTGNEIPRSPMKQQVIGDENAHYKTAARLRSEGTLDDKIRTPEKTPITKVETPEKDRPSPSRQARKTRTPPSSKTPAGAHKKRRRQSIMSPSSKRALNLMKFKSPGPTTGTPLVTIHEERMRSASPLALNPDFAGIDSAMSPPSPSQASTRRVLEFDQPANDDGAMMPEMGYDPDTPARQNTTGSRTPRAAVSSEGGQHTPSPLTQPGASRLLFLSPPRSPLANISVSEFLRMTNLQDAFDDVVLPAHTKMPPSTPPVVSDWNLHADMHACYVKAPLATAHSRILEKVNGMCDQSADAVQTAEHDLSHTNPTMFHAYKVADGEGRKVIEQRLAVLWKSATLHAEAHVLGCMAELEKEIEAAQNDILEGLKPRVEEIRGRRDEVECLEAKVEGIDSENAERVKEGAKLRAAIAAKEDLIRRKQAANKKVVDDCQDVQSQLLEVQARTRANNEKLAALQIEFDDRSRELTERASGTESHRSQTERALKVAEETALREAMAMQEALPFKLLSVRKAVRDVGRCTDLEWWLPGGIIALVHFTAPDMQRKLAPTGITFSLPDDPPNSQSVASRMPGEVDFLRVVLGMTCVGTHWTLEATVQSVQAAGNLIREMINLSDHFTAVVNDIKDLRLNIGMVTSCAFGHGGTVEVTLICTRHCTRASAVLEPRYNATTKKVAVVMRSCDLDYTQQIPLTEESLLRALSNPPSGNTCIFDACYILRSELLAAAPLGPLELSQEEELALLNAAIARLEHIIPSDISKSVMSFSSLTLDGHASAAHASHDTWLTSSDAVAM